MNYLMIALGGYECNNARKCKAESFLSARILMTDRVQGTVA